MQATAPIYFLDMPFAENGDKTIIPAEEASATGRATLSEGFPAITQTPIANGGIAPNRWDFNGMFFLLSQMAFWQQSGGIMTWQSTLGYTPPCMVYYGGKFWVALQQSGQETDAGAVTPVEGDYWTDAFNYIAGDKVFAETVTLTGDTTGSGTLDSSGNISVATTTTNADTADVATKLGSSTIGGIARGIYLSSGTATACSATVGSGTQPVYMKNGTITASSDTVGDSTTLVYLSDGTLTESSSTVGNNATPIYLSSGVLTACNSFLTSSVADATYATIGHVTFDNGFTLAWGQGSITGDGGSASVTYSVAFSSVYQCLWCDSGTTSDLSLSSFTTTQIKMTATENTTFRFLVIGKV